MCPFVILCTFCINSQKPMLYNIKRLSTSCWNIAIYCHDDVIKWELFPRYWPFVWGIHRPPVNFPHKSQWRRALMFSLICVWINSRVNNGEAGDLRRHRAHCGVIVMVPGDIDQMKGFHCGFVMESKGSLWTSDSYVCWRIGTPFTNMDEL